MLDVDIAQSLDPSTPYYNNGGDTQFRILVGGTEVAAFDFSVFGIIDAGQTFRTNLHGQFVAPTTTSYDIQLLIFRNWAVDPFLWGVADNFRITRVPVGPPVPDHTLNFTNGIWAGNLCLTNLATDVFLRADDGDGHVGDSLHFSVQMPSDTDGDGLPDPWELRYFGSLVARNGGPNDDSDDDGMPNLDEYRAGTDPTNPSDHLKIGAYQDGAASLQIRCWGVAGRNYRLERSETVAGPWTPIGAPMAGVNGPLTFTDSGGPGRSEVYYRVRLEP
jgi:hypothetical protein